MDPGTPIDADAAIRWVRSANHQILGISASPNQTGGGPAAHCVFSYPTGWLPVG